MLVLSRRMGERIVINDTINVIVQRVAGNRITLAIEAPPEVPILRGELNDSREKQVETSPVAAVVSRPTHPATPPLRKRVSTLTEGLARFPK